MADHAGEGDKSVQLDKQDNRKRSKPMKWNQEQHENFLKAVELVGILAGPKRILEVMEVEGITATQVGSHLQKYKLHLQEDAKKMKAKKAVEQRASFRSCSTNRGVASSSSPFDVIHTSSLHENEISPLLIASTTTENNWTPNSSTPYGSMSLYLNQLASQQNSLMQPNHSPYTQSNFAGRPVITQKGKEKISNQQANREPALLKNPAIPFIDLTTDSDCEEEHNNCTTANTQVASSGWLGKPFGAMNKPASGDGIWGSDKGKAIIKIEPDVQEVTVQNHSHAAMFVNPFDDLEKKSSVSSSLDVNNSSGLCERAESAELIVSTTMENYLTPKFTTQYGSMLLHLNQSSSEQNNAIQPNYSPHIQSNSAEIPLGVQRRGKDKKSNREANRKAMLENSTITLVDLTEDSDRKQEHNNNDATPISHGVNFPVESSGLIGKSCSEVASGDRDSTENKVIIKEEQDVEEMTVQNPNAVMFTNPLNILNKMSSGYSEQTVLIGELVEGSNCSMDAPLDWEISGDDFKMIRGYWDDEWNGISNELDPIVHGSTKSATDECSIEGEKGSSSNTNIRGGAMDKVL